MKKLLLLLGLSFHLTVSYTQQESIIQKIPDPSTALNASQLQEFNLITQHDRFEVSQLVQVMPLSYGIDSEDNLLIALPQELVQSGDCPVLEFKPRTTRFVDDQNYYYYGTLELGDTSECDCRCYSGEIMLEAVDGNKYGYIRADGIQYEIHAVGSNYSVIGRVSLDYFNNFEECYTPDVTIDSIGAGEPVDSRSGVPCEIKALFLYTPAALAASSAFQLNNVTNLAISQTNEALLNSWVNNVRVVKAGNLLLPGFVESGFLATEMTALLGSAAAATLRNHYSADVVCLIRSVPYTVPGGQILGASGFTPTASNLGAPMFSLGFMIVAQEAIASNFTFSHEFGHVLGCRHQICAEFLNTGCDDAGGLEHGHSWGEKKCFLCGWKRFSSILHQVQGGTKRLLNYSNPSKDHNGYPTGVSAQSDNAAWINSASGGCTVSDYFIDPEPPVQVGITGQEFLCKPDVGQYTALPPVSGSYSFVWQKSTNGINWGQPIGTTQSISLNSANYSVGQTVFLRVGFFDNQGGAPLYAFFEVTIGDPNDENCPRSTIDNSQQDEFDLAVYPNPSGYGFDLTYWAENENELVNIQLRSPDGRLLYEVNRKAVMTGKQTMHLSGENIGKGPMYLLVRIEKKRYQKLIIKQ